MADGSGGSFVTDTQRRGAGMILRAPGGRLLFLLRGDDCDHPGTWCWPGGGYEPGEGSDETALREAEEETGYVHDGDMQEIEPQAGFTTYVAEVPSEFDPTLNDEHSDFMWATPDEAPEPLHPGVEATLSYGLPVGNEPSGQAHDSDLLAFDRDTVREKDKDGRLHVSVTPISKANVCPYFGKEIPNWQAKGLDPEKIYHLLRDPAELKKAASTFNNLPLLSKHVPVTAKTSDGHQPELVIGSTGTDGDFDGDYLKNSLVIWAQPGIQAVESETKKELSSAYYYEADMTPGIFKGAGYDGVMRDIVGNHVALVEDGRAGDDVVVMDSALVQIKQGHTAAKDSKETTMTKTVLTRKAAVVQGALHVFLAPLLAQDAQIDLGPALKGVGPKNYKARKPAIATAIQKATDGKLAQDSDLDGIHKLLDSLDDVAPAEAATDDDMPAAGEPVDATATDDDPSAAVMEFLKDKLGEDDLASVSGMLKPPAATDEEDPPIVAEPAKDEEDEPEMVTPAAMDAAISAAVKNTADRIRKEQTALRHAEAFVRPWVGELVAMDSADAVYAAALKAMKVDVTGVHPSAFPAMIKMQPVPGAREARTPALAMDAAGAASYAKMFPDAARIQTL